MTQDCFLVGVVELDIGELAGVCLAILTNLLQFNVTVWHLINRHVWVSHKTFHGGLSGNAHLGESLLALSSCCVLLLLGKVFIDLLLAFFFDELEFEGVEKSLLVGSHLLDFGESCCVSDGSRVGVGEFEVDTDHVKFGTLLLDELEEVLLLGLLEGLSVLQDDQLELNDGLELGHVGSTNIKIGLIHELEAVLPFVKVDFIRICPLFNAVTKVLALVRSILELALNYFKLFHLGP